MLTMQEPKTVVRVDTPAGLVEVMAIARAALQEGDLPECPSFVMHRDRTLRYAASGLSRSSRLRRHDLLPRRRQDLGLPRAR